MRHQAAGTMTCYPTQAHYPDTEPTSPCPIIIMPSARLGSDKYRFLSLWFESTRVRNREVPIPLFPFVRVCMYGCGRVCACEYVSVCMCLSVCVSMCTCACVDVCARVSMYLCVCVCARVYVYLCVCGRVCACEYVSVGMYLCACLCVCVLVWTCVQRL